MFSSDFTVQLSLANYGRHQKYLENDNLNSSSFSCDFINYRAFYFIPSLTENKYA